MHTVWQHGDFTPHPVLCSDGALRAELDSVLNCCTLTNTAQHITHYNSTRNRLVLSTDNGMFMLHMVDQNMTPSSSYNPYQDHTQCNCYCQVYASTCKQSQELTGCHLHSALTLPTAPTYSTTASQVPHYCPSRALLVLRFTVTHLSAAKTASFMRGTH